MTAGELVRTGMGSLVLFLAAECIVAPALRAQQVGTNVDVGVGAEGSIAINPTDPANLTATANFNFFYSRDGGLTWSDSSTTSIGIFGDNNIAFDALGNV